MKKLLLFLFLTFNLNLFATIHSVITLGDAGAGSLRILIASASPGDTIDFSVAGTITLTSGQITIDKDLVFLSSGPANLTISGNSTSRIFDITAGKVHINSISFENGVLAGSGGAIQNTSTDTLTIVNCIFNSCSASFDGGAIVTDGAFVNISNSTFTNNHANFDGGGIRINDGNVLITSCTFNGNTTGFSGAGLRSVGGTSKVVNTTISGNTATLNGGGLEGDFNLINCTITGNSAANGGGAKPSASSFQNCIIYNNTASGVGPDLDGSINSNGNNLIGDISGSGGFLPTDILGQDPMLDVLSFNGGFTSTHALMSNSPCIDAGSCIQSPRTDQRDIARVGYPDIGAYEFGGTPFAINRLSQQICTGDSMTFGTQILDTTGVYTAVFQTAEGCDSTVELTLSLTTVYNETANQTICFGDTLIFGTQSLSADGIYTEVFTSSLNCDSTVELTLTVFSPDLSVSQSGKTLNASSTASSYQWLDCGINQIVPGDTNQVFTALANGQYAVIITENGCTDTSACFTVSTVGINESTKLNAVSMYPTKTADKVNVVFSELQPKISIKILDLTGKEIFNQNYTNAKNISLDLKEYKSGSYFIQIDAGGNSSIQRVIKTH